MLKLALIALFVSQVAHADSTTGGVGVTVKVVTSCSIDTAGEQVDVTCRKGSVTRVAFGHRAMFITAASTHAPVSVDRGADETVATISF